MARTLSVEHRLKLSLARIGKPSGRLGIPHSDATKKRWSEIRRGKPSGFKGKRHSASTKIKFSNRRWTLEMRQKISDSCKNRRVSADTRRKLRLAAIQQHQSLPGPWPGVDKGATEFFNNLNQTQGFHIQHPNFLIREIGYFLDGYDPVLHAAFEFDTPCHLSSRQQKKDLLRQQEIVEHFELVSKPLTAFYRVNKTGAGEPGMKNVLVH